MASTETPNGANGTAAAPSPEDIKLFTLSQKYSTEAAKRLRADGLAQFERLSESGAARFRALAQDPWVDHAALNALPAIPSGTKHKILILGAGYGGLLFAVRLLKAGIARSPEDLLFVDAAGGFGGTWWWNRYPGLRCDIESYSYMPLLEETGYVPTQKYVSGNELREHAERIAEKWGLQGRALFRAGVKAARWDEEKREWVVEVKEERGPGEEVRELELRGRYLLIASGIITTPHIPVCEPLLGRGLRMAWRSKTDTAGRKYPAWTPSPAPSSTRPDGTMRSRAVTRLTRRWPGSRTSAWASLAPVRPPSRWCPSWPSGQRRSMCFSGRRRTWGGADTSKRTRRSGEFVLAPDFLLFPFFS